MTAKENKRKPARKRRPYMRKSLQRKPKDTVLIACEGGKTEPIYFEALKQDKRLLSVTIAGKECGSHPKSVVKYAKKKMEEGFEFDVIWCVFDRDDHPNIHEAFTQANDNGYDIAFSNPCFELWYFLHYADQTAHIKRDVLRKRKLKKKINNYDKSMDVYSILLPKQKNAIERAEKLREKHSGDDRERPEDQNPSTGVDILVEYLNSLS